MVYGTPIARLWARCAGNGDGVLLDLVYGHRSDGRPVDVNAMVGDIKI